MLTILSSHNEIINSLNRSYFNNNLITFNYKKILSRILIIIDPFCIEDIYFTLSPIWKQYLSTNSSDTKLIVMGFMDFSSRNYIDLLKLPDNFEAYLENALPVSADWEIPIDGADMRDYMRRFFEGHGRNSGLSKLNALKQTFNIAYTGLADNSLSVEEIYNDLIIPHGRSEWEELLRRWKYYFPYFEYLPFYPEMVKINDVFSKVSQFFSCEKIERQFFIENSIDRLLDGVYQDLHTIDKSYIRPELYQTE